MKNNRLLRIGRFLTPVIAGVGLAGLLAYCPLNRNDNAESPEQFRAAKISLEEARKDNRKRQEFLDDLLRTNEIPYCSGVVYDHDGKKIAEYLRGELLEIEGDKNKVEIKLIAYNQQFQNGMFDAKVIINPELSELERKSKIFVGRELFDFYTSFTGADIRHLIAAHEGRHVEQHVKGLFLPRDIVLGGLKNSLLSKEVLYFALEYDASAQGLRKALSGEFNVSRGYLEKIKKDFFTHGLNLTKAGATSSPLQRELIFNVQKSVAGIDELKDVKLNRADK